MLFPGAIRAIRMIILISFLPLTGPGRLGSLLRTVPPQFLSFEKRIISRVPEYFP